MYRRFGKRLAELLLVSLAVPVVAPVMGLVALVVRLRLGSPVFFRQLRPGHGDRPFRLIKFRTMTDARAADGELLSDAERLTSLGQFLRSTSLDELPELLNVLKGEMSLVGPRPLLMEYLDRYTPQQRRRHEVKPGITGWAQVNGRNALTWKRRFAHDVWYVDHLSFWVDVRILLLTVGTTLKREGISQSGHVTMEKFTGTEVR
jgi:lipopolysaccharide/colanic/teichoic acid biosynthesis glycosyltransferase